MGLDPNHPSYSPQVKSLLTSNAARKAGIRYLDGEVATVCYFTSSSAATAAADGTIMTPQRKLKPLRVYGNPMQPEFLGKPYAFIYPPAPSAQATAAWASAPSPPSHSPCHSPCPPTHGCRQQGQELNENNLDLQKAQILQPVDIWLMHSPPFGRLDRVPVAGLTGCSVQAEKIAAARPRLCVFGHYHYSWGVERVHWPQQDMNHCEHEHENEREKNSGEHEEEEAEKCIAAAAAAEVTLLAASAERQAAEGFTMPMRCEFDFTGSGDEKKLIGGEETVYVNAGWMTMRKTDTEYRNPPFVVTIPLD